MGPRGGVNSVIFPLKLELLKKNPFVDHLILTNITIPLIKQKFSGKKWRFYVYLEIFFRDGWLGLPPSRPDRDYLFENWQDVRELPKGSPFWIGSSLGILQPEAYPVIGIRP